MKHINKKRWIVVSVASLVLVGGVVAFIRYEVTKKPVAPPTETITWTAPAPIVVPGKQGIEKTGSTQKVVSPKKKK